MIHKSEAIAKHSWCGGADYAYVYRYEDGTIKYLTKDGERWQDAKHYALISDEEADKFAHDWGVREGRLPDVVMLDVSCHAMSYTCDGITFGGQAIPIQTLKYALGQLVPFVYNPGGECGIEIQPQLLMGISGVLTEPKELDRIIKTWELVNERKECMFCGRYIDKTETDGNDCNMRSD